MPLHLEKVYAVRRPREHSANKCVKVRRTITCTELFSLDQASRTDEIELQLAKELLNPQVTLGPSENRIEIGCTQDFRRTPPAGIGSVNIEQVHKSRLILVSQDRPMPLARHAAIRTNPSGTFNVPASFATTKRQN